MNPLIYSTFSSTPDAFYDVISGFANTDGCCEGFKPGSGWDAVTGVGTPNYAVLKTVVMNV